MGCKKLEKHHDQKPLKVEYSKAKTQASREAKRELMWLSVDPPLINGHYLNGNHDGGVYNSFNLSAYGYCRQNPVIYVDPDGNQFQAIKDVLKNKVMPLVESAGNKLKQTANQVRNTATRMVNEARQNVVQKAENMKASLNESAGKIKESAKRNFSVSTKQVDDIKTSGEIVSNFGTAIGITGLAIFPVNPPAGATVGLGGTIIGVTGLGITSLGKGLEGDYAGVAVDVGIEVISGGLDKLIDAAKIADKGAEAVLKITKEVNKEVMVKSVEKATENKD